MHGTTDLTPEERQALKHYASRSLLRPPIDDEIEAALESKGLITRKLGGYGLTDRGARVLVGAARRQRG